MKNMFYHALVWKENHLYVAKALELEIASQGQTRPEALKNLKEAIELYFEDENLNRIYFPKIDQPQLKQVAFAS